MGAIDEQSLKTVVCPSYGNFKFKIQILFSSFHDWQFLSRKQNECTEVYPILIQEKSIQNEIIYLVGSCLGMNIEVFSEQKKQIKIKLKR